MVTETVRKLLMNTASVCWNVCDSEDGLSTMKAYPKPLNNKCKIHSGQQYTLIPTVYILLRPVSQSLYS